MGRIIFDIETAGCDFGELEEPVQNYLLKWAETENDRQEVVDSLALYPNTGEIVAIGLLNPDTQKGAVYYRSTEDPVNSIEEEGIRYEPGDEKEIISRFWNSVKNYDQIITFNGRGFDCPFIMVRSAVHRIKPSRNLLPYRFGDTHIDLLDQLSFLGASRRKFSLDMWCRTFGIRSPKESGITGKDVNNLFLEGKFLEIAKYCSGDLSATAELLSIWETYIKAPAQNS